MVIFCLFFSVQGLINSEFLYTPCAIFACFQVTDIKKMPRERISMKPVRSAGLAHMEAIQIVLCAGYAVEELSV